MSGGIAQLVAVGAQDAHLVGNPEVSFFRSSYKRHTNFSQTVERQVIQGNPAANGMSTVRFERKGDLLGQVYFTAEFDNKSNTANWSNVVSKVELLIGGQIIDTQDYDFMNEIVSGTLANTYAKSSNAGNYGSISTWFPLRFFFCENVQSYLPLIALQYHDVELRITWGSDLGNKTIQCWANYVYLDTNERELLSATPQKMLITQVQTMLGSQSKNQELTFNHPVKFIASIGANSIHTDSNKVKLQINGVDVSDFKFSVPHFGITKLYYNTSYGSSADNCFLYPFCLDTSKLQPTGTLNFSRLDSARIVSQDAISDQTIYAVNYNILRIENGMGGLTYSN